MTLEEVRAMTPKQKNEKLAELTGIEILAIKGFAKPMGRTTGDWFILPDYCNDLNAVHNVERLLDPPPMDREQDRADESRLWRTYSWHLATLCPMGTYVRATADQRATALILTLAP